MYHCGTNTIITERLILRRFTAEDAPAMFRNWANDPEVTKYLTWPPHASVDVTENLLHTWVENYEHPDYYQWAIVLKELGEPIGSIAVVEIDHACNSMEVGYCIGRTWWHQGYTSEALNAVMDELFERTECSSIDARHDPRNPNSGAVMRKCGMIQLCVRHGDHNNQGECDAIYYNKLASEHRRERDNSAKGDHFAFADRQSVDSTNI